MNIQPLGSRVLVKITQDTKEETTTMGIVLPKAQVVRHYRTGVVQEMGGEVRAELKGATVVLPEYGGVELEEGLFLIEAADILGTVNA